MTKRKDSGATPRQYDEAFKREAVRHEMFTADDLKLSAAFIGSALLSRHEITDDRLFEIVVPSVPRRQSSLCADDNCTSLILTWDL